MWVLKAFMRPFLPDKCPKRISDAEWAQMQEGIADINSHLDAEDEDEEVPDDLDDDRHYQDCQTLDELLEVDDATLNLPDLTLVPKQEACHLLSKVSRNYFKCGI